MKRVMKTVAGLIMSLILAVTFVGCGGTGGGEPQKTPAEEAVEALDVTLAALKSADMDAINDLGGGEDIFSGAEEAFGSEEGAQSILKAMFGHFDYKIGTPEQVDDSNVNVLVTVTNADMSKVVNTWFSEAMSLAASDPNLTNDETALQAKIMEMFGSAVETVAGQDGGTITNDVVFPMTLKEGKWVISDTVDDDVLDKLLGGMMTAISGISGGQ